MIGLPCVHAMTVIMIEHEKPFDFVDDSFKKKAYMEAYTPMIYDLNGFQCGLRKIRDQYNFQF